MGKIDIKRFLNKNLLPVFVVLLFVGGLILAFIATRQTQNIHNKAASPTGVGSISLSPLAATHYEGDLFPVSIRFNTGGVSISSIALRITYSFTGTTPELDVTDQAGNSSNQLVPDSALASTGWSFPVNSVTRANGQVTIDFAAINTSTAGYASSMDSNLATIYFKVNRAVTANPLVVSFDPTQTKMITKDGSDVLGMPSSASYTLLSVVPVPQNNAINWNTGYVALSASNFYIKINGVYFKVDPATLNLNSDPGTSTYTTLEGEWKENGVDMRLFMYFSKDVNGNWSVTEVRTYNGKSPGDWLYYNGFAGGVGPLTKSVFDMTSNDGSGMIHFENFSLQPFLPLNLPVSSYGYILEPKPVFDIHIVVMPNTGYGVNVVLKDANSAVVTDQSNINYQWIVSDPNIVTVVSDSPGNGSGGCLYGILPPCPNEHAGITGHNPGIATITVNAVNKQTNAILATANFRVFVTLPGSPSPSPTPEVLNINASLQGFGSVTGIPDMRPFTVTIQNGQTIISQYLVDLTQNSSGVYTGSIPNLNITPGIYTIFIKDFAHLKKNISAGGVNGEGLFPGTTFVAGTLKSADFNDDNTLNIIDLGKWLSIYTSISVPVTAANRQYDLNNDGVIDISDIGLMLSNYINLENPGD